MASTALRGQRAEAATAAAPRRTPASLVALAALEAWVWTASALPKLTSGRFVDGFSAFVGAAHTTPAAYGRAVEGVVRVAPPVFALGALGTESLIAATFLAATVALVTGRGVPTRRLAVVTSAASLLSALFALDLALLVGDGAPWQLGDPFDSGVALEYLIAGLGVATAVSMVVTVRGSDPRTRLRSSPRRS